MNIKEIKELSLKEMEAEILKSQKELLQLNLRRKQLEKPHQIGVCRKNIARLKTVLKEKLLQSRSKEGVSK